MVFYPGKLLAHYRIDLLGVRSLLTNPALRIPYTHPDFNKAVGIVSSVPLASGVINLANSQVSVDR